MEAGHQWVPGQELLDPVTLHTDTAAVDQADLSEAPLDGLLQVGIHHIRHIPGWEWVEVDAVLDRNLDRDLEIRLGMLELSGCLVRRSYDVRLQPPATEDHREGEDREHESKHREAYPSFRTDHLSQRPGGNGRNYEHPELGGNVGQSNFGISYHTQAPEKVYLCRRSLADVPGLRPRPRQLSTASVDMPVTV